MYSIYKLIKAQTFGNNLKLLLFRSFLFIGLVTSSLLVHSQSNNATVSGLILDEKGEAVVGASVQSKISQKGAISDVNGKYTIQYIANDELTFSFVGYEKQTIGIKNRNVVNVSLEPSSLNNLDEVVVVGYGTLIKREVTTAISKVKGADLNQVVNSSVSGALRGKSTGVRIFNPSGAPGVQASVTIRGGSSINKSNDALVLIDGMPGSFSQVNPQDVESIEILKDAASTAIYGSRASNGIVLITTKTGKKGKPVITINRSQGAQSASRRFNKLNAQEYLTLVRPALVRSPYANLLTAVHPAGTGNGPTSSFSTQFMTAGQELPIGWKSMVDPLDPTKTLMFEDNDLQDDVFSGGTISNTYIGVNGGSETGRYLLSLGYVEDNSYTPNRDWASLTLTSNTENYLSKKFKVNTNLLLQRIASTPYAAEGAIFSTGIHLAPTIRSVMEDGTTAPGRDATYKNPNYIFETISNKRKDYRMTAKIGLTYEILKNLFVKGEAYHNALYNQREFFEKKNFFNSLRPAGVFNGLDQITQFDASINYSKSINDVHKISALVGGSALSYNEYDFSANSNGSSRDDIFTLNAAALPVSSTSSRTRENLNSAFSRLSYNFKQKYLFSATFRADGSSKFAEGKRWGYFPGASLAYVISDEDFMKGIKWLSNLKARTSYGITGNNSVGRYAYQGVWNTSNRYLGQSSSNPTAIPNDNLTWENTNQFDAGLEFGFIQNKVNLAVDYYSKITNDLLFFENLPNTSGFGSIERNTGKVKFWGYEAQLDAKIINTKNVKLSFGANYSYNLNKVLKLPFNGNLKNRANGLYFADEPSQSVGGLAEGERLYAVIGYKMEKIIDTPEEAAAARFDDRAFGYNPATKTYTLGKKFAGDYEWVDKNGDGRITNKDQFVLGSLVPTSTGGFNTALKVRNWELYGLFDFAMGHVIYDRQVSLANAASANGFVVPTKDVLSAWKQPGDAANTTFARFDIDDGNANGQWNYFRTSDQNTYKGDYLAFRELKLSHDFSKSLLKNRTFRSLQLYASGQNIFTFTKYPGYITEFSGAGRNSADGNFPLAKIWSLGLSTSF